MSIHPCCMAATGDTRSSSFIRRCRLIAEWTIPGVLLALIPKCPLCVAATIALATGVGISVSTAMYFRFTLIFICVAALLLLTIRWCVVKLRAL